MSAMSGTVIAALMRGRAAAASASGTATRINSHPAVSNWRICSTVAVTSLVSVEHIDWTETGASPPIFTLPTWICLVGRLVMCIVADVENRPQLRSRFAQTLDVPKGARLGYSLTSALLATALNIANLRLCLLA